MNNLVKTALAERGTELFHKLFTARQTTRFDRDKYDIIQYTSYKIKVLAMCHNFDKVPLNAATPEKGLSAADSDNFAGSTNQTTLKSLKVSSDTLSACLLCATESALLQVPKKDDLVKFREASEFVDKVKTFATRHNVDPSKAFRLAFRFGVAILDEAAKFLPEAVKGGLRK